MNSDTMNREVPKIARAYLAELVRDEYPFLKDKALGDFLDTTTANLEHMLIEQEPIMAESKKRTSFFSLSTELRNRIYYLVLTPPEAPENINILIQSDSKSRFPGQKPPKSYHAFGAFTSQIAIPPVRVPPGSLALLQLNKKIRSESAPIFWGNKTFFVRYTISSGPIGRILSVDSARAWLQVIGKENAGLIKKFKLMGASWDLNRGGKAFDKENALKQYDFEAFGVAKKAIEIDESHYGSW